MRNKTMEIYVDIRQKAMVDPEYVIGKLISKEIGSGGWIFEKDGKYFMGYEASAGQHSIDVDDEITKEKYDYVAALQFVLKNLREN
jgi:hypothetical protein